MSQLSRETLQKSIETIVETAKKAKSDFIDTVSVKFTLKHYDPNRNRALTSDGEPLVQVCVLGDEQHCEEAVQLNVPFINFDELGALNRNTKLIKQLARRYDGFLVSDTIMDEIRMLLGPGLYCISKTLGILAHGENMIEKVEEMKLKIQDDIKKVLYVTAEIGHVNLGPEKLEENALWAVNYLVPRLERSWRNVQSITIMSAFGPVLPLDFTC